MITAEELTDAYEAEVQSRGIPPLPELREARVGLSAGVLARLEARPWSPDSLIRTVITALATQDLSEPIADNGMTVLDHLVIDAVRISALWAKP